MQALGVAMQSSELLATRRQNSVPVTLLGQPYGEHDQSVAKLSRMESNQEGLTLASCSATQSKSKQSTNFNLARVRVSRVGGVFASKSKSSSSESRVSQLTLGLLGRPLCLAARFFVGVARNSVPVTPFGSSPL